CMVLVFVVGASGMLAACARPLTAVAPARTAAAPNRRLRVNMSISFSALLAACGFHLICAVGHWTVTRHHPAAEQRRVEIGARQPKITLRLDCCDVRGNSPLRFSQ